MTGEQLQRRRTVLLALSIEGGLGGLAYILGMFLGQPPFSWGVRDGLLGVAACLPMLGVFLVSTRLPWSPLVRIRQFSYEVAKPLFASCSVLELGIICLVAGVGEEMFFRGILQGSLDRWWGPWTGLVLASLVFGLMHPLTPAYVVLAALMGLYLGGLWMASGNLLVVIIPHALYDWIALLLVTRGPLPTDFVQPVGQDNPTMLPPSEKKPEGEDRK